MLCGSQHGQRRQGRSRCSLVLACLRLLTTVVQAAGPNLLRCEHGALLVLELVCLPCLSRLVLGTAATVNLAVNSFDEQSLRHATGLKNLTAVVMYVQLLHDLFQAAKVSTGLDGRQAYLLNS